MPILVKDPADGTWKPANTPTSKLLHFRWADTWYAVANAWIRDADTWKATDYVGIPGAPVLNAITTAANDFANMGLSWSAPTTGAPPASYTITVLHQDGSPWGVQAGVTGLSYTWPVTPDMVMQIYVTAVSAAGVAGPASNIVKYAIGHPQQTRQDPVYGWGTPYDDTSTAVNFVSSQENGYPGSNAADYPAGVSWDSYWLSWNRTISYGFEGVRLGFTGGNRRIASVKVWPRATHAMYLGLYQGGQWWTYYGNNITGTITDGSYWLGAARGILNHNYFWQSDVQSTYADFRIPSGYGFTADQCLIDVAISNLSTGFINGYRAAVTEILIEMQDWTVVSYTTVVTVNQQNCYYW